MALLSVPAQAGLRQATGNLVVNGDAEGGPGATTGEQIYAPLGWATTGAFTAGAYGTQGLPAAVAGGGSNLFAGGPNSAVSTAVQTVDVSAHAAAIDAGERSARLSALLGGWESQGDFATVEAFFIDSSGVSLGSVAVGPVTSADRGGSTILLPRSATKSVPPGTRSIRLVITAERMEGSYNDGYSDSVSLALGTASTKLRYRFGFRLAQRSIGLSTGSSGSFTTSGQPDSSGATKIVAVNGKNFTLAWNYRGKRWKVGFRFRSAGRYYVESHHTTLMMVVRTSNFRVGPHRCRIGTAAILTLKADGGVRMRFCGTGVSFTSPDRATSWVKPA